MNRRNDPLNARLGKIRSYFFQETSRSLGDRRLVDLINETFERRMFEQLAERRQFWKRRIGLHGLIFVICGNGFASGSFYRTTRTMRAKARHSPFALWPLNPTSLGEGNGSFLACFTTRRSPLEAVRPGKTEEVCQLWQPIVAKSINNTERPRHRMAVFFLVKPLCMMYSTVYSTSALTTLRIGMCDVRSCFVVSCSDVTHPNF